MANSKALLSPLSLPQIPSSPIHSPSRKRFQIRCSFGKFGNFLDLKPESKPELLKFDLPLLHPYSEPHQRRFDVVVVGAGPAGLRLSEQLSDYGIKVCCVDPSPLSPWPNNYGVWVDEFQALGLQDCFHNTWPMASVYLNDRTIKYLDRPYAQVSRKKLKMKLMEECATKGVKFHKAKVWEIEHHEFESSVACDDGTQIKANLVIDASGFASKFTEYSKPRNCGFQIAHGILAEVESHPFDINKMVLMDWRDSHLGNEPYLRQDNKTSPTFLYAMPFDSNLIFLEETSLVGRPPLPYAAVKRRMAARLRHLGIKVKRIVEEEKCVIPMGGPLPEMRQGVVAVGGAGGIVHPASGYAVVGGMVAAADVARRAAEGLGGGGGGRMIRGRALQGRVWDGVWPVEKRRVREFYCFGMETLVGLDLDGLRMFFDAFFDLEPFYWEGFLSSRLSLRDLCILGFSLFVNASPMSRLHILTKCPRPLLAMLRNIAIQAFV